MGSRNAFSMLLVVWQLLALFAILAATEESCIQHYYELEESLLANPLNLDSLTQGFFPPNEPSVAVVEVFYSVTNSTDPSLDLNVTYRYRWSDSPMYLFMDPGILEKLSLYTTRPSFRSITLVIEPICDNGTPRDGISIPTYLLNQLTAHLKEYAYTAAKTRPQTSAQGYVSYFNESTSEHIVVDFNDNFQINMLLLVIGLIALATFMSMATPMLLHEKYPTMYRLAQKEHSNHVFVIWAAVIACGIATVIITIIDVSLVLVERISSNESPVWPSYIALVGILIFLLVDLLLVIVVKKRRDFPLPYVMKIICCDVGLLMKDSTLVVQTVAMWVVVLFLQLAAFHLTFIFLAFVASPVETGSFFLLYVAGFISTISIIALFLATVQNNFSFDMTSTQKKRFIRSLCLKSARLIPFFCLLVFTIFFATSFVRVTISVGDSETGGIPSLFAAIAPAILLGILGYAGRHILVKYVPRRASVNELPTTISDTDNVEDGSIREAQ